MHRVGRLSAADEALFANAGRFSALGFLGKGGMGRVYRVFDAELGREVALKTLHETDATHVVRLKTEFRALADIVHPNLVELYELIVEPTHSFITMELIDGVDLATHVGSGAPRTATRTATRSSAELVS